MRRHVIMDTGPLVASLNRRDRYHEWARGHWTQIPPPLLTCEAVLAETCFLLQQYSVGVGTVLELINRGIIRVDFRVDEHADSLARLMAKYADVPMSLADACLVRMSEIHQDSPVFTLDGDFHIYRRLGRHTIPIVMPVKER